MLTKRIIACLDVRDGRVVKGVQFRNHRDMGDIAELARRYREAGVDELVFYDITASSENRTVDQSWVNRLARFLDIPFCVAGGIRSVDDARAILNDGADKISINSPALERPELITELAQAFGSQCVVVGIDSRRDEDGRYAVYQYTGDASRTIAARRDTLDWAREVADRGAGEIVLNCMDKDGMRDGYDIGQLRAVREVTRLPLIASGGAGKAGHFDAVFNKADVDGALAASVFHTEQIAIPELKRYLEDKGHQIRL